MKKTDLIKRPSCILEKPRKFNKLWLDKNENTHPKLLNLYSQHKIFEKLQRLCANWKNLKNPKLVDKHDLLFSTNLV